MAKQMTTLEKIQAPTEGRGKATDIPRIPEIAPSRLSRLVLGAKTNTKVMTHEAIHNAFIKALEKAGAETSSVMTEEGREIATKWLIESRLRQGLHVRSAADLPEGQRFLLENNGVKSSAGLPAIRVSIVERAAD